MGKEEIGKERKEGEEEEEEEGERSSSFSLDFPVIGLSVWVKARGKVGPRIECYAWVPKLVGFVKL